MITKEQIIEILNNHAGYIDRSRTEKAVHEDNFNDIADEILSKLRQHDVIKNEVAVCCSCEMKLKKQLKSFVSYAKSRSISDININDDTIDYFIEDFI